MELDAAFPIVDHIWVGVTEPAMILSVVFDVIGVNAVVLKALESVQALKAIAYLHVFVLIGDVVAQRVVSMHRERLFSDGLRPGQDPCES